MKTSSVKEYITLSFSTAILTLMLGGVIFSGIFDRVKYNVNKNILNLYVATKNN
jgi:hypothetical protein